MKSLISTFAAILLLSGAAAAKPPQKEKNSGGPPPWAYPVNPPDERPMKDDGELHKVPGSDKALTVPQIRDSFNIPDWHPEGHPAMPQIVAHGRTPGVRGCGFCHLPNGQGRPENASLAGLPADYMERQAEDFRMGTRKSSEPNMSAPNSMILVAENATVEEVKSAAEYFSSLKFKPWVKIVETNTVPKTKVKAAMLTLVEGGGTEPIGNRIIETPVDFDRTELRDDASGFIAYVPMGSIKKGEALVTTGGAGKTTACGICHGTELQGLGPIPRLAGRSPSYLFRQLYDLQHGSRKGPWSELMKAPVAQLSETDMISIAAYIASRAP